MASERLPGGDPPANEAVLRALLAMGQEIALVVAPDGVVEWASPSWERRTGHPLEEIVGQRFDRHIPRFDRDIVALEGDPPPAHQPAEHFLMRHRAGTSLNMAGKGCWIELGGERRHLLLWEDVTESDGYSDGVVLISQAQPLRDVMVPLLRGASVRLNHGLLWAQTVDKDGRLASLAAAHLPPGWLELADGFAPDDPRGPTCVRGHGHNVAILDFAGADAAHPMAAAARELGVEAVWSMAGYGPSGDLLDVVSVLCVGPLEPTPLRLEILTVTTRVVVLLHEAERSSRALRRDHRHLSFHMDNSPLAAVELDRAFRIVRWSPHAARMLGWTLEQVQAMGPGLLEVFDADDRGPILQLVRTLREGTVKRGVVAARVRDPEGRVIETEWHVSALREGSGDTVSFMALGQDVTARHQRAEEILRTQKWESLGVLTGGIAHDFNNLLTAILGHAELAALTLPEGTPARGHLEHVQSASERASKLMQQLLNFSGRGISKAERLDLNTVVSDMPDLLAVPLSKAAVIGYELSADPLVVEADEEQLRQVVLSVVTNACEALSEEGGTVTVRTDRVRLRAEDLDDLGDRDVSPGEFVLLEVVDDGAGMDAATAARAFDPFFTTKEIGRGLGLAALSGILRGLGGLERLQSTPGRGTRIRIFIPAAGENAGQRGTAPRAGESGAAMARPRNRRILVADDDDTVREFVTEVLAADGYRVEAAADGAAALEILRSAPEGFELVVLDRTMQGMDGVEALPLIREVNAALPVLVTSGHDLAELREQFGPHQPDAFLLKPFRPKELLDQVAELRRQG
ncbi:MAG: response regulator [Deltaproteobacteria bacterium]|nr:response regulator [Deltaproteobacteria bacterium]